MEGQIAVYDGIREELKSGEPPKEESIYDGATGIFEDLRELPIYPNLALYMKPEDLRYIGNRVCEDYRIDESSREKWVKRTKEGEKFAQMELPNKNWPTSKSANICYPLISEACVQFSARAAGNIVQDNHIVKAYVTGDDQGNEIQSYAEDYADFQSHQQLEEMNGWEEDMDELTTRIPLLGCLFKKIYWENSEDNPESYLIPPYNLVVDFHAKSLRKCNRMTELYELYPHEIESNFRSGIFRRIALTPAVQQKNDIQASDRQQPSIADEEGAHLFYEQHRYWDLDGDGLPEPYIITVHHETEEVVRIKAAYDLDDIIFDEEGGKIVKIRRKNYYVKYSCLPNPEGGFYDVGYAYYMVPLQDAINSIANQLVDTGTWNATHAGVISKQLALSSGETDWVFEQGEFKIVGATVGNRLEDQIWTLPKTEPSPVLLQLLQMMIASSEKFASMVDVLLGQTPSSNIPATTILAMIEQGMMVFSQIFKRIHRSLKEEYQMIFALNRKYMKGPRTFIDSKGQQREINLDGLEQQGIQIVPISDPKTVLNTQKMLQAQELGKYLELPEVNRTAIIRRIFDSLGQEKTEELIKQIDPESPEVKAAQDKVQLEIDKIRLENQKIQSDIDLNRAKEQEILANARKDQADIDGLQQEISDRDTLLDELVKEDVNAEQTKNERPVAVTGTA